MKLIQGAKIKINNRTFRVSSKWFSNQQIPESYGFTEIFTDNRQSQEIEKPAEHVHELIKQGKIIIL